MLITVPAPTEAFCGGGPTGEVAVASPPWTLIEIVAWADGTAASPKTPTVHKTTASLKNHLEVIGDVS
jgi:hypothetical protein